MLSRICRKFLQKIKILIYITQSLGDKLILTRVLIQGKLPFCATSSFLCSMLLSKSSLSGDRHGSIITLWMHIISKGHLEHCEILCALYVLLWQQETIWSSLYIVPITTAWKWEWKIILWKKKILQDLDGPPPW